MEHANVPVPSIELMLVAAMLGLGLALMAIPVPPIPSPPVALPPPVMQANHCMPLPLLGCIVPNPNNL